MSLVERILDALPQTQCTRCGYPNCLQYAQAIANEESAINQCPPGGAEGIVRLAAITGKAEVFLNPDNGIEAPRTFAVIDGDWCFGCTLCLDACPTDAPSAPDTTPARRLGLETDRDRARAGRRSGQDSEAG